MDRRTDGRTDMTKLIVAFRNFANMPKIINELIKHVYLFSKFPIISKTKLEV